MNRLLIILCMFLLSALPGGAGNSHTVPAPQRMITSDVFLGIRTRVDERTQHLYVSEVAPDSPAARADIRSGDALLSVNDHKVHSREGLFLRMRHSGAGDVLQLQLRRGEEQFTVNVTLTARPAPAIIGRVHANPPAPVAMGNLVSRQYDLAVALSCPGTTLADVEEQLRRICRDAGGRAARTGHIRLTYRDKDGLIRLRHRPGRLEIITSGAQDSYSATILTQPWHTLPPAFQRRFRNITENPKVF